MDATEVAAVLARARLGDSEAFRALVERHSRRAFQLAYRMTGNEQDAEDVVQESFIRAYRQLSRFEARAHFSTWLHRIVANCSVDLIRSRRARYDHTSTDDLGSIDQPEADVPNPERLAASAQDQLLGKLSGDAPFCDTCGHITVRNGTCYKCLNCGNSMGCS